MMNIPEIFNMINKYSNLPIYFTGSESDIKQNPWMKRICDKIEIGDIRKSLSLVRDAEKIISNDTGLAHCAGAMNKDILILWKDTPFIKNQNTGKNTKYSLKENWESEECLYYFKTLQEFCSVEANKGDTNCKNQTSNGRFG